MQDIAISASALVGTSDARRGEVRDVLGERMLGSNTAGIDFTGFTGLGEGVVTGVEVLAFLEVLCEVVGLGRKLAVEAEETLLIWRQRLYTRFSRTKRTIIMIDSRGSR